MNIYCIVTEAADSPHVLPAAVGRRIQLACSIYNNAAELLGCAHHWRCLRQCEWHCTGLPHEALNAIPIDALFNSVCSESTSRRLTLGAGAQGSTMMFCQEIDRETYRLFQLSRADQMPEFSQGQCYYAHPDKTPQLAFHSLFPILGSQGLAQVPSEQLQLRGA